MMSPLPRRAIAVAVSLAFTLAACAAAAQTPWAAPAAEKARKSPVAASPKVVARGKQVAQVNCAACQGTGARVTARPRALSPKPADWTSKKVQDESDGEIFWKITTGRGAMPPWKHLPGADRWALVQHIRSLKK